MAEIVIIDDMETTQTNLDEVVINLDNEDDDETEEGEIEEESTSISPVILSMPPKEKEERLNVPLSSTSTAQQVVHSLLSSPEIEKTKKITEPPSVCLQIPTFEIKFKDKNEYNKYNEAVLEALKASKTLSEPQFEYVQSEANSSIQAFGIEIFRNEQNEINKAECGAKSPVYEINSNENSNDSIDYGDDLNKLFTIDSTPSTKLEISQVPSYKRQSRDVLDLEVKTKMLKKVDDDTACPRPRPSVACFNCGSHDHGIRDCPEPRNNQRIARAKRAKAAKGDRYHVDVDQRFSHLKPGEISEKLRKALGLRKHELPAFFVRMRVCGYPPGWLEESKVSHSGLAMFNTGDDVLKNEENTSEAEIKYDISKIIEFPGFNVMPEECRDNYKYHNVPPYNKEYSKEAMIAALGDTAIKGFKRKKLKDHTEASTTATQIELSTNLSEEINKHHNEEMEIDDDIEVENVEFTRPMPPPLPPPPTASMNENEQELTTTLPPLPPSPTPPVEAVVENSTSAATETTSNGTTKNRTFSPTLEELQAQQRDLLLKLTSGADDDSQIIAEQTANEPKTPATPTTPTVDLQKIIKTSHIGTPVLQFSEFDKIPNTDNFKVGVSDVINFENLPDSTGKYEVMKEVISKVRRAKKRLAEEEDD